MIDIEGCFAVGEECGHGTVIQVHCGCTDLGS